MTKLKLGTIGTSWITDSFIDAAHMTNLYDLTCVYSRNTENATSFAMKYGDIATETDFDTFIQDENLDVIYIASPNTFHFKQTLAVLNAGKHTIVEKPASINIAEWDEMLAVAEANNVFVFEAVRHIHDPNLETIAQEVKDLGDIYGATLAFAKYSSRYDNVLAGEDPNIFSTKFAGGALMDLGIYPIYTAVYLFGEPVNVQYFPRKIKTGVDGIGTVILQYDSFDVTILVSKISTSFVGMEFYGENETILVDHVTEYEEAKRINAKTYAEEAVVLDNQYENRMVYEAEVFANLIYNQDEASTRAHYKKLSELARIVSGLLFDLRMKGNIRFDFEK